MAQDTPSAWHRSADSAHSSRPKHLARAARAHGLRDKAFKRDSLVFKLARPLCFRSSPKFE
eukprot:4907204-Heterocapsa_arctica.AAC.1